MALECFTWITGLLGSLFLTIRVDDGETFERLPDCLIIDILSRLPAHSFIRCRWVCRRWRALVSSHDYFTTLHDDLSRASRPMVLIQDHFARNGRDLYVFGENKKKKKKKKKAAFKKLHLRSELMINKYWEHPFLLYSCQGVLLFASSRWQSTYYVLNPITQEEVTIQHTLHPGFLCALYFCPYTRQFRILYVQVRGSFCQYFVYIFRTQTWRKIRSSSFNFLPSGVNSAVVNGALHWVMHHDIERKNTPCENGIMVFRMNKEELSAMPHPGSTVCNSKRAHRTMTLFVKDDCLSFCNLLFPEYAVDIWILEDYETRAWIKRYKVNLSDRRIFPFSLCFMEIPSLADDKSGRIKLLNIQEGELLLLVWNEGLFLYNLDHRTMKRIELPRQEMKSYCTCRPYMKSFLAIA